MPRIVLSLAERSRPAPAAPSFPIPRIHPHLQHPKRLPQLADASTNGATAQKWHPKPIAATIENMFQAGLFAMHVLEVMFFVGMAGSAIVVVISFIEDAQELFGED